MKQTLISNFLDEEDYFPAHLNYCSTMAYRSFIRYYNGSLIMFLPRGETDYIFAKKWLQLLGLGKTFKKLFSIVESTEGLRSAYKFGAAAVDMLIDCYTLVKVPNDVSYLNVKAQKESAEAVKKYLRSPVKTRDLSFGQLSALIELIKAVNNRLDQYAYKFLLKHEHSTEDGI